MSDTSEFKVPFGTIEITITSTLSPDQLMENLIHGAIYSMIVGEDHVPRVERAVKDALWADDTLLENT